MKTSPKQSSRSAVRDLITLLSITMACLGNPASVWAHDEDLEFKGKTQIIDPGERYRGKTYSQLSAAWWQWVYSIPPSQNPVLDTNGAFAHLGQDGPIFFLAGNFGGTTVREVSVPAGKALFFPLLNQSWVQFPTDPILPIEELRDIIASSTDNPRHLSCAIDGTAVRNLVRYRIESRVFSVTLPSDNLLGLAAGTYEPCVDDGYYLLVEPLKKGRHTIHFSSQNNDGTFTLDVTYHLNVVDPPKIVPHDGRYLGKTYPEWAAKFWQWMLGLPLAGHPVVDDGLFDFSAGQSGKVWYWASPEGTITREVILPEGKAFLLSLRDVDTSSLEEPPFFGATEEQQRSNSVWFADHIIDLFCTVDGIPIDLTDFRFLTRQFQFTAPTPFIFGATGGVGTAVGDGYFLLFPSLSKGRHTIHYGGTFHFEPGELADEALDFTKDTTIEMTVGSDRGHHGDDGDDE